MPFKERLWKEGLLLFAFDSTLSFLFIFSLRFSQPLAIVIKHKQIKESHNSFTQHGANCREELPSRGEANW